MRQPIRLNLRHYGTGYKSANSACGSLHSSRVHRAVSHPDAISLPKNKYKPARDICCATHASRLYKPINLLGENFIRVSGHNGQVSRLDRPNEWVKFEKIPTKNLENLRERREGVF
jgi:hypothetical protein